MEADKTLPIRQFTPNGHLLPVGYMLEDFEILGVLGEGGFGAVYLVRDRKLDQKRAIKEYLPGHVALRGEGLTVQPRSSEGSVNAYIEGRASFIREAQLLAGVDHPTISVSTAASRPTTPPTSPCNIAKAKPWNPGRDGRVAPRPTRSGCNFSSGNCWTACKRCMTKAFCTATSNRKTSTWWTASVPCSSTLAPPGGW